MLPARGSRTVHTLINESNVVGDVVFWDGRGSGVGVGMGVVEGGRWKDVTCAVTRVCVCVCAPWAECFLIFQTLASALDSIGLPYPFPFPTPHR